LINRIIDTLTRGGTHGYLNTDPMIAVHRCRVGVRPCFRECDRESQVSMCSPPSLLSLELRWKRHGDMCFSRFSNRMDIDDVPSLTAVSSWGTILRGSIWARRSMRRKTQSGSDRREKTAAQASFLSWSTG